MNVSRLNHHTITDTTLVDRLMGFAEIEPEDTVLEIGAGEGAITAELVKYARKVIAFEKDQRMRVFLDDLVDSNPNLTVKYQSALVKKLPKFNVCVSNIPFNITEPLIQLLYKSRFRSSTLIVGNRFAKAASSSEEVYSLLAAYARSVFHITYDCKVESSCFTPEPSTDAAIITLQPKKESSMDFESFMFSKLYRDRNQTLVHCLKRAVANYAFSRNQGASVSVDQFFFASGLGEDL
ncbi:MAG: hypothetical protein KKG59_03270, partial [Nanoarchaeota archaeon]|nr:hypothetical protein [Nanoarchaeota archaeon]